jgi:hypothetical protein
MCVCRQVAVLDAVPDVMSVGCYIWWWWVSVKSSRDVTQSDLSEQLISILGRLVLPLPIIVNPGLRGLVIMAIVIFLFYF